MVSDLVAPLAFACRLLMVMWGCGIARWNRVPSIQNLLACKATGSLSPHRKLAKLTNYSPGNTCAASIICDLQGLEELQQRSPPHICRMEEKKICGMQQLQCSAQNVICTIRYYMYSSCQSISATSWKMCKVLLFGYWKSALLSTYRPLIMYGTFSSKQSVRFFSRSEVHVF